MAASPRCPGCGCLAPPAQSGAAKRWSVALSADSAPVVICPACAATEERCEVALANAKRPKLAFTDDPDDAIVFVDGGATLLADCTPEEREDAREEIGRSLDQARAWAEWLAALKGKS